MSSYETNRTDVNPFRDPRWGRGQEVAGEDPYHISSYVKALVLGLQGPSNDTYKRTAATCKHFTAYDVENWHGMERYEFDAKGKLSGNYMKVNIVWY